MKESVAIAKEADRKKGFSPTRSDNSISIHSVRNEPERQLGALRSVIDNIRREGGTPSVESIATELSSMPSPAQRASVLLALQQTHGNRYVQHVVAGVQAKLKVGQPGDVYEQEADRVADAVMRMPEPGVQRQSEEEGLLQAKHISEQITPLIQRQVEPEEEEEAKGHDRRVYSIIHEVLSQTGGSVEDALTEVARRREENPMDLYLAAVEHYMYARSCVAKEGWLGWIKMVYGSEGYYVFKKIMYAVGAEEHIPRAGKAVPTPPTRMAVRWGKEGASDGLVDYKKRQRPSKSEYRECLLMELERAGGIPSEAEVIEAVKNCSEKTGYPAPHVPEEGAHEYIEQVREGPVGQEGVPVQPKQVRGRTPGVTPEVESRIESLRSSGQPLPESVRAYFEPRFGYDFSKVRVHTDARAVETVRALNAHAFTMECDIYFDAGKYSPKTFEGKKLLAHELTHVVQHGQDYYPKVQRWKSHGGYTLTIYSKAPDEYDSTGHAFISIENTKGNEYYYGFYPECKRPMCRPMDRCTTGDYFKMMVGVGASGIVCSDRGHSFTSSLDYQITEDQFRAIKDFADEKRSNPPEWDIWTYNCVDFATQAARTGGIEPPSSGWFLFTPAELEKNILRAPQEYEECLGIEFERPGGVPSEEEIMEAIKKCSEETGYPAPDISEEEAFEHLEDVRRERFEPEVEEEPIQAEQSPGQNLEVTSDSAAAETTVEHAAYQDFRQYLFEAIKRLEAAAGRTRGLRFGRAAGGQCVPTDGGWTIRLTGDFDARYWDLRVDCAEPYPESKLVLIAGTPTEAIDELFNRLDDWSFDCLEYLQVARWYAMRHTLGPVVFNDYMSMFAPVELLQRGSTGIFIDERYKRESPNDKFARHDYVTQQTEPTDKTEKELLDAAPVGTRVTWKNMDASEGASFQYENTFKVGDDAFASHPYGTGSRRYIECRLALEVLGGDDAMRCRADPLESVIKNYIDRNIFISYITLFDWTWTF